MVRLRYATVEWTERGAITFFNDGTRVEGHAHFDDPHYRVASHRMGNGDDLLTYCRFHEVAHSLVAQWFRNAPSHVLWNLAHELPLDPAETMYEEIAAQVFQRWLCANERPILAIPPELGLSWDGMRDEALALLAD